MVFHKGVGTMSYIIKNCPCYDYDYEEWMSYSVFKAGFAHSFEESLAELINNLWQDLTEEERNQIKEILE